LLNVFPRCTPLTFCNASFARTFLASSSFGGKDKRTNENIHTVCGTGKDALLESALPPEYFPLEPTPEQDKAWSDLIRQHITLPTDVKK